MTGPGQTNRSNSQSLLIAGKTSAVTVTFECCGYCSLQSAPQSMPGTLLVMRPIVEGSTGLPLSRASGTIVRFGEPAGTPVNTAEHVLFASMTSIARVGLAEATQSPPQL